MVEQEPEELRVVGSIPIPGTIFYSHPFFSPTDYIMVVVC